ncbi:MAG: SEC-C domain-containing protein [Actinomycetota bacterium]|nr:SEC-C domain-containing protein [Actinomycetota bacterium]
MNIPGEEEITHAAQAILGEGPLPSSVLVERLDALGVLGVLRDEGLDDAEIADVVVKELLGDNVWATTDDTVFASTALTDGMVLTHRLSAEELDLGVVGTSPDLVALDWSAPHGLELGGGEGRLIDRSSEVRVGETFGSLGGPEGWLTPFKEGGLVAFRRLGLTVEVGSAGELADGEREVDRLRATIDGRISPHEGEEAFPLLLDALAADADAFRRPVPPLGELLERAGLERRGFTFGRQGQTWFSRYDRARQKRREEVTEAWGFDTCCRSAFDHVDAAFAQFVVDPRQEVDAEAVNRDLGHSAVGLAFADYQQTAPPEDRARLVDFATRVADQAPGGAAPSWLLAGSATDNQGDVISAEGHVRRASLDAAYGPAAATLSRYQIDRSDITGAIASLRHPDLDAEGPVLAFLLDLDRPYRQAGRNQPCPCGSGRKFKECCARHRSVPLAGRTALLSFKLALFATRPEHQSVRLSLADAALDPEDPEPSTSFDRLAVDSMINDLALWEGGLAARYLAERSDLLPPDERELLTTFLEEPRRLWEVTAVDEGSRLDLRDTKTGDAVSVDERTGSVGRKPGDLILARVAHVGAVNQILGSVMEVPPDLRDSLIPLLDDESGAKALARWYGAAITPLGPLDVGRNRDGD